MAKKEKKEKTDKKFEEALGELEGIVERLESGKLSLEESLSAFEQGVGLVKYCNQKLNEVEKRIELLIKDREGRLQVEPLAETADEDPEVEES